MASFEGAFTEMEGLQIRLLKEPPLVAFGAEAMVKKLLTKAWGVSGSFWFKCLFLGQEV